MASHIEQDLRADMPNIARIYTYIESRGTGMGDSRDVTEAESGVVARVRAITDEVAGAARCHDVIVRRQANQFLVSLHCRFDKQLSIIEVHDLSTRIEDRLKARIPGLTRVVIHAEPDGPPV